VKVSWNFFMDFLGRELEEEEEMDREMEEELR
jgi:hypothetical protein